MPEYSFILTLLFIATLFLHRYFKLRLFSSFRHALLLYVVVLVIAVMWDQFAIWRGHWSFNEKFLLGSYIGYMPIEEYGFVLVMPYFGLVLYKLTEKLVKK